MTEQETSNPVMTKEELIAALESTRAPGESVTVTRPVDEERNCSTCAWYEVDCNGARLNTRGCEEINGLPLWDPRVEVEL